MNQEELNYLDLMKQVLNQENIKSDRTGVGTKSIFGAQLRFSLENDKLPVITTRKIFTKAAIQELLFFIRGETNSKILEAKGVNIWKGNTSREFLDKQGLHSFPEGEMGKMYGYQWRNFAGSFDQLQNVFNLIKTNPDSRRIMMTAFNPAETSEAVLFPCHPLVQFYVEDNKLSCLFYMRSNDLFLGFCTNILTYSILTHLLAKANGLEAKEVIYTAGDVHLYSNHLEQATLQLSRKPFEFPTLEINKEIHSLQDIEKMELTDFKIHNYEFHPAIKAEMAV